MVMARKSQHTIKEWLLGRDERPLVVCSCGWQFHGVVMSMYYAADIMLDQFNLHLEVVRESTEVANGSRK